jgi:hypothetical protein
MNNEEESPMSKREKVDRLLVVSRLKEKNMLSPKSINVRKINIDDKDDDAENPNRPGEHFKSETIDCKSYGDHEFFLNEPNQHVKTFWPILCCCIKCPKTYHTDQSEKVEMRKGKLVETNPNRL